MTQLLALDIGGANIKIADGQGYARSWPFELWKSPEKLADKLCGCLTESPAHDRIVVTMTGELCDCFETKREGVRHIVDATIEAAGETPVLFYQATGEFVSADEACEKYLFTAASNWHALATFAARYCDGKPGLLIDIGSTTTDMIPIVDGKAAAQGDNDMARLAACELVYQGVERTPVCGITSTVTFWKERSWSVANELFATSGDVYLLTGDTEEDPLNNRTADGKPFTREAARSRIARVIGGDRDMVSLSLAERIAHGIKYQQLHILEYFYNARTKGWRVKPITPEVVIVGGQGEFLARQLLECVKFVGEVVSLNVALGPEASRCAPAHALAVLAKDTNQPTHNKREINLSSSHTIRTDGVGNPSQRKTPLRVVKVGGSVMEQVEPWGEVSAWLSLQPDACNILVAGGGSFVDEIRRDFFPHSLKESAAHWAAIGIMGNNSATLAGWMNEATLIESLDDIPDEPAVLVLKPFCWLRDREPHLPGTRLIESWAVTSDSIAARIAICLKADEFVLLKMAEPPSDDVQQLADCDYIDKFFPKLANELPHWQIVNLPTYLRQKGMRY